MLILMLPVVPKAKQNKFCPFLLDTLYIKHCGLLWRLLLNFVFVTAVLRLQCGGWNFLKSLLNQATQ